MWATDKEKPPNKVVAVQSYKNPVPRSVQMDRFLPGFGKRKDSISEDQNSFICFFFKKLLWGTHWGAASQKEVIQR